MQFQYYNWHKGLQTCISTPLLEFAKAEIERLSTLFLGDENSSGRNEAIMLGSDSIS